MSFLSRVDNAPGYVEAIEEMTAAERDDEVSEWADLAFAALMRTGIEYSFDRELELRVRRVVLIGEGPPPWDAAGIVSDFEEQAPYKLEEAIARSHDIRALMSFVETAEMPIADMMKLRRLKAQVAVMTGLLGCPVTEPVRSAVRRWADIRHEIV